MKKFMALLCAGVLACSMSMMAFAAPSQTTSQTTATVVTEAERQQDHANSTVAGLSVYQNVIVDGNSVNNVAITGVSEGWRRDAVAQVAATFGSDAAVLAVADVNVAGSFDKVTIPFSISGVKAGDNIVILHCKHDGTWETITPDSVEDGVVTVTFTSLSPVVFVNTAVSATVANGVATSPKTGEAVPYVAVIALVAVAGAAVAGKKAFN